MAKHRGSPGNEINKLIILVGAIIILLVIALLFNGTMNSAYATANNTTTNQSATYPLVQVGFFLTGGVGSILLVLVIILLGILAIIGFKIISKIVK